MVKYKDFSFASKWILSQGQNVSSPCNLYYGNQHTWTYGIHIEAEACVVSALIITVKHK